MRKVALFLSLVLLIVSSPVLANQIKTIDRPADIPSFLGYAPGQLIVQYASPMDKGSVSRSASGNLSVGIGSIDAIAEKYEVTDMRQLFHGATPKYINGQVHDLSRHFVVEFDPQADLEEVYQAYLNDPGIESVEKNGIHAMYATPNDGYFSYQWYHNQTSDHDIDSPEAWDIQTGSDAIIVADLDSGTRYFHPDLGGANASYSNPEDSRGNMWINDAELNGSSGVDDDGNGYVDDWIGWDFISSTSSCWSGEDCSTEDNDPRDFNGHGTHTAGIIGMISNDGYGMAGTAGGWNSGSQAEYGNGVKVMALRMGYSYNYGGTEYGVVLMDAAASAFYYAADNGAKIASCSWGSSNSGGISSAADYFIANGGIICVAAGNDGTTSADYLSQRGDCIDVAATDENDDAASYTTYGTWVDICAPGDNIYSTYHDHSDESTTYWASMSGTSMATPMVAGVCGLIWSQNPTWTAAQVETQLYTSSDDIDAYLSSSYIGKMGAGRINAYNAVNTGTAPPVAAFTANTTSGCAPLTVNFTDESTGDVSSWDWDFGDGTGTSTSQNPSYTYTSGGTYTVALTVTGEGGSDTETKTSYITVNVAPTAGFSGTPTSGEVPVTVTFTNSSSGATSYSWDFGDTGSSTATNPSHTYTAAGTYTVTLTATNACGSDDEVKTDYITVTCTAPVADFTGSPTSGDAPLTVNFTDASTGATAWSWDFGDGVGTSTSQNPSYTYDNTGTYTVALTVTNSCGNDTETKTDYITVTCTTPTADFSGSPTSGTVSLTVNFTDASTGATSWAWDFGDGVGTSTAQNPSYTYDAIGTYTVALTVTNACGNDTETKVDYIDVQEASAEYATLPYSTGFESGSFDDYWFTQSSNSEGRIQITSSYTPRGSYHLAMDDNTNGSSYAQNEAWLKLNLAGKSDVDLTFYWKEFSDETHTQDGVYFSDDGGSSFTKVYNLSGGTSTYQQIALDVDALASSNGLSLTGTFVVKFQQYDNYGLTTDGMTFDDISVTSNEAPPVADFSASPTSGVVPLSVTFTDASSGATSWSWDFGDGVGTSTAQNPSYTYNAIGTYTVTLTATNAYGSDVETKTDYINVTEGGGWTVITYDDFESGWGNYTDGGGDCSRYTSGTYACGGSDAILIRDNSGTSSSFYHTSGYDVSGYSELEVEFCFYPRSMDNSNEDFWVQYYDGSTWQTVATYAQGTDFDNGTFYNEIVTISSGSYNFPSNAKLRFMCDASGNRDYVYIDEVEFRGMSGTSALGEPNLMTGNTPTMPDEFSLLQNYPNPFNPSTTIMFTLTEQTHVRLDVYNIVGQKVATLVDNSLGVGEHTVTWNAGNMPSGIYLYRLQTDQFVESKRMMLVK